MEGNDRMKEWRQTIAVICAVVLAVAAGATFLQFALAGMRADINDMREDMSDMREDMHAQNAAIRADMDAEFAAFRADMDAEFAAFRADMDAQITGLRADTNAEFAAIRELLGNIDRRTARIEGHLFGIEVPPERAEGE